MNHRSKTELGFKDTGVWETGRTMLKEKGRPGEVRFSVWGPTLSHAHLDRLFS